MAPSFLGKQAIVIGAGMAGLAAAAALADCFEQSIRRDGTLLHVADLTYDLATFRRIVVLAIGKAALPSIAVLPQPGGEK